MALMNELTIKFDGIGIDTQEMLQAEGTKWNFLRFRPGLVGGHYIGVDPYYLTHQAEMLGYHSVVILAGNRINDGIAEFISQQTTNNMIRAGRPIRGAKVIVLDLTFKENFPDLRDSKVADLVLELNGCGCEVHVHGLIAVPAETLHEYAIRLTEWDQLPQADALVAAESHSEYLSTPLGDILGCIHPGGVFVDVKSSYPDRKIVAGGYRVWRL
jgi:UDP-N-acetyl-D-galactosamine dehydrogenase